MLFFFFSLLVGRFAYLTDSPVLVANLMREGKLSVFGFGVHEGQAVFSSFLWQGRAVKKLLSAYGVTIKVRSLHGLPAFFYRYRTRVGALLGAVFAVTLTVLSSRFIWQIDVVGNSRLSDEAVLSALEAEGVFEGAYVGNIDPLSVANRCAMASEDIAWMSVNLVGNCVEVVVLEHNDKDILPKDPIPSNIVARKSGIVRRIEVESGVAAVKEGSVVQEGQLLISGVNQLRDESYIYQPAKGRVFVETMGEITVEKTLLSEKKVYSGEVFGTTSYIFFTKSKKFTEDYGNLPPTCDRIETKERVMLFGKIPLPIWIVREEYRAFDFEEITLSEIEAKAAALSEAWLQLSKGELIWAQESYSFEGGVAKVTLRYRMIEDVAENLPLFEVK
ncbi:MAG: sporulation protein YqfD [Clostridia bacterium]|nr:sporulation protein YqfD [Clostridia bacterium]